MCLLHLKWITNWPILWELIFPRVCQRWQYTISNVTRATSSGAGQGYILLLEEDYWDRIVVSIVSPSAKGISSYWCSSLRFPWRHIVSGDLLYSGWQITHTIDHWFSMAGCVYLDCVIDWSGEWPSRTNYCHQAKSRTISCWWAQEWRRSATDKLFRKHDEGGCTACYN